MSDLLSQLVEFTEPLVVGGYALTLLLGLVYFSNEEGLLKSVIEGLDKRRAISFPVLFPTAYALGLVGDEFMYWLFNATGVHDMFITNRAEAMTVSPKDICGDEIKKMSHRDIQGLLSGFPVSINEQTLNSTIIDRANYSLRLCRGIIFYSFVASIVAMFTVKSTRNKIMISIVLLAISILSSISFFAIESAYHRSANYEAIKYLTVSPEGQRICQLGLKEYIMQSSAAPL